MLDTSQQSDQIRIFPIRFANTSPTGIAGNFHIRIKRPVHVHGTHFLRCLPGYLIGHQRIKGTGKIDVGGIYRIIRRIGIAMDGIDTEYNRYLQAALHSERLQIVGFFNGQHMQKRTDQAFFRPLLYIFLRKAGIESICRIILQFFFGHHGTVCLDMFHTDELIHLTYFLLQSHSFQEIFYPVLYGCGRVFIHFLLASAAGTQTSSDCHSCDYFLHYY